MSIGASSAFIGRRRRGEGHQASKGKSRREPGSGRARSGCRRVLTAPPRGQTSSSLSAKRRSRGPDRAPAAGRHDVERWRTSPAGTPAAVSVVSSAASTSVPIPALTGHSAWRRSSRVAVGSSQNAQRRITARRRCTGTRPRTAATGSTSRPRISRTTTTFDLPRLVTQCKHVEAECDTPAGGLDPAAPPDRSARRPRHPSPWFGRRSDMRGNKWTWPGGCPRQPGPWPGSEI